MRKSVLLFIIFIQFSFAQNYPYQAKYKDNWAEVNNSIKSNWDSQLSKSNDLPRIFISVYPWVPFMFYWDTYFTNKGLLIHDYDFIAEGNTENLLSVVDKFGYMGNCAVTNWGMNRSQPPYLSEMVMDIYKYKQDTAFLRRAYAILKKEYLFWTDTSANAIEQHNTPIKGLQRFYAHPKKEEMVTMYEELADRFNLKLDISDDEKAKISFNYAVEAATGMDFTPRFEHRCPDFIAVELNSLLYTYEINFDFMVNKLSLKGEPNWMQKAIQRKELVNKYCWNESRGLYLDYDYVNKRHCKVAAITTFQPLWAGLATPERAAKVVKNMPIFESEWGMITTEKCGEIKNYQWGETSVWAPMQVMVAIGLDKYGYKTEAQRVATKYLDMVTRNFLTPTPESYTQKDGKIVKRSKGKTHEKYKSDGSINDDEYKAADMMGWTAGSFAWFYQYLSK
jgi:alpha,alpha-trehalase